MPARRHSLHAVLSASLLLCACHSTILGESWVNYVQDEAVRTLLETTDAIWAGSQRGPVRFDATTSERTLFDTLFMAKYSAGVQAMAVAPDGSVWIACSDIIMRYADGQMRPHLKWPGVELQWDVRTMLFDTSGAVWIHAGHALMNARPGDESLSIVMATGTTCIAAIDKRIWVGTESGLFVTDIAGGTLLRCEELCPITGRINGIVAADTAGAWIGADSFLVYYRPGICSTASMPHGDWWNPAVRPLSTDGGIWVEILSEGGMNGWVARWDGVRWAAWDLGYSGWDLCPNRVASVVRSSRDTVWISAVGGIYAHVSDTIIRPQAGCWPHRASPAVSCMLLDRSNRLWHASLSGVCVRENGVWAKRTVSNVEVPIGHVNALALDSNQTLWVASNEGLCSRRDGRWREHALPLTSGYEYLTALTVDQSNRLWVGTTRGLFAGDGTTFVRFDTANSPLPHNWISALAVDTSDRLWIGTVRGLSACRAGSWLAPVEGAVSGRISALRVDSRSRLWIGMESYQNGLCVVQNGVWQSFDVSSLGLPTGYATDFTEDRQNRVWVTTVGMGTGSVAHLTGTVWSMVQPTRFARPVRLLIAHNGEVWVGSMDAGMSRTDSTTTTIYRPDNSPLIGATITDFAEDDSGTIWVGTTMGLSSVRRSAVSERRGFDRPPRVARLVAAQAGHGTCKVSLPSACRLRVAVFTLSGRLVHTVLDRLLAEGTYELTAPQYVRMPSVCIWVFFAEGSMVHQLRAVIPK